MRDRVVLLSEEETALLLLTEAAIFAMPSDTAADVSMLPDELVRRITILMVNVVVATRLLMGSERDVAGMQAHY